MHGIYLQHSNATKFNSSAYANIKARLYTNIVGIKETNSTITDLTKIDKAAFRINTYKVKLSLPMCAFVTVLHALNIKQRKSILKLSN